MLTKIDLPLDNYICVPYIQGRIKEKPYKRKFKLGIYSLKFIHTDIAGPFPVIGYN